jgi:hypothetical protein
MVVTTWMVHQMSRAKNQDNELEYEFDRMPKQLDKTELVVNT